MAISWNDRVLIFGIIIGFILSIYTIYIELNLSSDQNFVASCDINQQISCSKVITSKYGHILSALGLVPLNSILDRPNCEYGVLFYLSVLFFYSFSLNSPLMRFFLLLTAVFGMVLSCILAYIMVYILQQICIICYATYVVNTVILVTSCRIYLKKYRGASSQKKSHEN
jgi:vitamin-K-epoxide reductase (warfarin-sensitive)